MALYSGSPKRHKPALISLASRLTSGAVHAPIAVRDHRHEIYMRLFQWLARVFGLHDPAVADVDRHVVTAVIEDEVTDPEFTLADRMRFVPLVAGEMHEQDPRRLPRRHHESTAV